MNATDEFKARLVAVGEKIKVKGWKSASVDLGVHYLAIFDHPMGPDYPMINFTASIRSNSSHNYVDGWSFKTMEEAITALEITADKMPTVTDEEKRKADALAKLSPDELRLIGAHP